MRENPYSKNSFKTLDAYSLKSATELDCDIVIIGSGAGGGVAAEILSNHGLKIILLESGPLHTSDEFKMDEAKAYQNLYQDSGTRKTADKSISILQGRCVGGSTTINWTSSFRTPLSTRKFWKQKYGIDFCLEDSFERIFDEVETDFGISHWEVPPNENNSLLEEGAKKLKISSGRIKRNVKDCHNLGYCGMGCPVNAKQGTLLKSIPEALRSNVQLIYNCHAKFIGHDGQRAKYVMANKRGSQEKILKINTKYVICAAGSIGTPALLLKSGLSDPYENLGKRTFLHPVTICAGVYDHEVEPYYGAPQSVYSDHFLNDRPIDGPMGFKIEVPPIHPLILATALPTFGKEHLEIMQSLPHIHALLSLQRDGFHNESQGGQVKVLRNGEATLDYPFTDYLKDGFRESLIKMAKLQFAAGAKQVMPLHLKAPLYSSFNQAKDQLEKLSMEALNLKVLSAHVMGGAPMGGDPKISVVNLEGRHHQVKNLYVMDGSVFPTSIGANPMESIYAFSTYFSRKFLKMLS